MAQPKFIFILPQESGGAPPQELKLSMSRCKGRVVLEVNEKILLWISSNGKAYFVRDTLRALGLEEAAAFSDLAVE